MHPSNRPLLIAGDALSPNKVEFVTPPFTTDVSGEPVEVRSSGHKKIFLSSESAEDIG